MEQANVLKDLVRTTGANLHYTIEGTGIPLLVVGSSIYYPRTFSHGLKRHCTIVSADLPHFVEQDAEYNLALIDFDAYADNIESIRIAMGFERVVIVGHSHHGNVALEYAKRYTTKVSHVVMIGSPPVDIARTITGGELYWSMHASAERKKLLQERRNSIDREYLASLSPEAAYIFQYITDAPLYWHVSDYDATPLWCDMHFNMNVVTAFHDLFKNYEMNWDSTLLRAPVLEIMGMHDYAVPHIILPKLQNTTFHVLELCGHTPQLEAPEAFDMILLNWLHDDHPE